MPSPSSTAAWMLALLATVPFAAATSSACPPLGPVLPAPKFPSKSCDVQKATSLLRSTLRSSFEAQMKASAISVGVKSIHEDAPLFNYHFTPPKLSGQGTDLVDEDTMYRVGSVSKLFPILMLLQSGKVSMDDSIVKYIPGLADIQGTEVSEVSWEDITIGALASHLSGLGTDMAFDLALFPAPVWGSMGLPEVPKGTGPSCSGLPGTKPCTDADLIRDLARRPPVYLPNTSPVYSNIGFALLGLVAESVTGLPFPKAAQAVFDSVGMPSSAFDGLPKNFTEKGFIPAGETTWNLTTGVFEAAGGMFSSPKDLLAFADAILSNKLLPAHATRKWLQPTSHTTSTAFSVGAPWEILRSDTLTLDNRTVDVYTKTGDLGLYHAVLALVPDYDVVVTVLTGGPEVTAVSATRTIVLSTVLKALVPAIESAGREEVDKAGFLRTFVDVASNSSMTLASDEGPGLVIDALVVKGYDVLDNFNNYGLGALGSPSAPVATVKADGRLYPSNRVAAAAAQGNSTETAWRAVVDSRTEAQRAQLDARMFHRDGACTNWFGMDRTAYNFLSLQDFVITTGADGAVRSIRSPAFNVTMVAV